MNGDLIQITSYWVCEIENIKKLKNRVGIQKIAGLLVISLTFIVLFIWEKLKIENNHYIGVSWF